MLEVNVTSKPYKRDYVDFAYLMQQGDTMEFLLDTTCYSGVVSGKVQLDHSAVRGISALFNDELYTPSIIAWEHLELFTIVNELGKRGFCDYLRGLSYSPTLRTTDAKTYKFKTSAGGSTVTCLIRISPKHDMEASFEKDTGIFTVTTERGRTALFSLTIEGVEKSSEKQAKFLYAVDELKALVQSNLKSKDRVIDVSHFFFEMIHYVGATSLSVCKNFMRCEN